MNTIFIAIVSVLFLASATLSGCQPTAANPEALPEQMGGKISLDNNFGVDDVEEQFKKGEQGLLWLVDNSIFDTTGDIPLWSTKETTSEMLWKPLLDAMFPKATIMEDIQNEEYRRISLSNGISADISSSLTLRTTDKALFTANAKQSLEETVLAILPTYIGMDLQLYEERDGEKTYAFLLDGVPLDVNGYGIPNGFVPGAFVTVTHDSTSSSDEILIAVPYLSTDKSKIISRTNFISPVEIKTICAADLTSQYGDAAVILILEEATLVYSFQTETQEFIPSWRINGKIYKGDYHKASRLVNALTGELRWG